jgi:hypothetical protein
MSPKRVYRAEEGGEPSFVLAETTVPGGAVEGRISKNSDPRLAKRGSGLVFQVSLEMAEELDGHNLSPLEKAVLLNTLSERIEQYEGYDDSNGLRRVIKGGVVVMNGARVNISLLRSGSAKIYPLYKEFAPQTWDYEPFK